MKSFTTLWKSYWFRRGFLAHLAICRIAAVAAQLCLLIAADVYNYNRLLELSVLPGSLYQPLPILRAFTAPLGWNHPLSYEALLAIYAVTITAGILALIGWKTNLSLAIFALGNIWMQAYSYSFGDLHHPEALMIFALAALATSPAGKVLSLDSLQARIRENTRLRRFRRVFRDTDKKSIFAAWPLVFVQALFALIYLDAGVHKLLRAGLDWMNGYTLQFYLFSDGLKRGSEIGVWLGHQHVLAWLLSWITMLFETTFFSVLIYPILAWIYVPAGLALHAGMCVTGVACFYQYMALYTVFIPWVPLWRGLKAVFGRVRIQQGAKPEIIYDGRCLLCIRSMTTIHYFDWFGRLAFSDLEGRWPRLAAQFPEISLTDCEREIHLLLPDGSVRTGFFAFRTIASYLPVLWPLSVVSYLPGSSIVGPKVYRWVASRRARFHGCDTEACPAVAARSSGAD